MKAKNNEFEKFDETMDRLLSVPYSELKKKLNEEKDEKKKKQTESTSSSGPRFREKDLIRER